MNADGVFQLVVESARRFGDRNPQEFKHLSSRLRKAPELVVANGLLKVFTEGAPPPLGSPAQELAGKLLIEIRPCVSCSLEQILRASIEKYELSVEQFPIYLAGVFGYGPLLVVLDQLAGEALSDPEQEAVKTMKFWIRNLLPQNAE